VHFTTVAIFCQEESESAFPLLKIERILTEYNHIDYPPLYVPAGWWILVVKFSSQKTISMSWRGPLITSNLIPKFVSNLFQFYGQIWVLLINFGALYNLNKLA
jgi:hypothetical protein